MSDEYQRVIGYLMDEDISYKDLVTRLAQKYPEVFLDLVIYGPTGSKLVNQQILTAVRAGRKVDAIKLLRQETGKSLRDAKDIIDNLARKEAS